MTREKEIHIAMKESVCETIYSSAYGFTPQATDLLECAFTNGANWADKTMLDRACKWLQDGGYFVNSNETIEDFRKAMEGGAE